MLEVIKLVNLLIEAVIKAVGCAYATYRIYDTLKKQEDNQHG
jgi:hypothetical protein